MKMIACAEKVHKNSTHADGVLGPGSADARPSARPPIDMNGHFPAHVSASHLKDPPTHKKAYPKWL